MKKKFITQNVFIRKRFAFIGIFISLVFISELALGEELKLIQGGIPIAMLYSVCPFKYKTEAGTCFVINIDNRQYIITARHLVPDIKKGDAVQLYFNQNWNNLIIEPLFPKNVKTDIAALATDRQITQQLDIPLSSENEVIGQDVYFLGFPFGLHTPFKDHRTQITETLPFVKKAIFSANDPSPESGHIHYLDGHNNPGFSGGPVIFANRYKDNRLQIAGVIAGYRNQPSMVLEAEVDEAASQTGEKKKKLIRYVQENSGIVVSYSIGEIVTAIRANPIGFPLPQSNK